MLGAEQYFPKKLIGFASAIPLALPILGYYMFDWEPERIVLYFFLDNILILIVGTGLGLFAIRHASSNDKMALRIMYYAVVPILLVGFIIVLCITLGVVYFLALSPNHREVVALLESSGKGVPLFFVEYVFTQIKIYFIDSTSYAWATIVLLLLPYFLTAYNYGYKIIYEPQKIMLLLTEFIKPWYYVFLILYLGAVVSGVLGDAQYALWIMVLGGFYVKYIRKEADL